MSTQSLFEEEKPTAEAIALSHEQPAWNVNELFSAAYEELRRLASSVRKHHGGGSMLSPTTLVNEAWLRLASSRALQVESMLHFKFTAARAMRQILVEAARRKDARKRGGALVFVTLDEGAAPMPCDRQLLALHDSLDELGRLHARQAKVVESRYFGGMDVAEIASVLDISEATVLRDWRAAKAWLGTQIGARL